MNKMSTIPNRQLLVALLVVMALGVFVPSVLMQQQGGPYTLNPSVIAGGGGTSTNGNTTISGTVGQGVLGASSGGSFSLNGGFWQSASPCSAPSVSSQPSNQTVCAGVSANFSVTANGTSPSYQWRRNTINLSNGGNISGATSATLTINPAGSSDAGSYDVVITAACGIATSDAATLTINSYSLSSMSQSFPGSGGSSSVNVIVAGSCPWAAVSNAPWITVTGGTPGNGNGTVNYSVANNTGGARNGTITIAGLTFTVMQAAPTFVDLIAFNATGYDNGVYLEWKTGFEVNNLGFRVYRDQGGQRVLLNQQVLAGSALVAGSAAIGAGRSYSLWDSATEGNVDAQYWLEDIDLNGQSSWHGPIHTKQIGGKPHASSQAESLSQIGQRGAVDATHVVEAVAQLPRAIQSSASQVSVQQASLASERGVKIGVRRAGWYRLSQAELIGAGLDPKTDPRTLRLFVDGTELPIKVAGQGDGRFDSNDSVEFYGLGLNTPSTDTRVYWLTAGTQAGLRISKGALAKGYPSGESFAYTVERRDRTIYFSALKNGDEENFFGAVVSGNELEQRVTLNNVASTARDPGVIELSLQGVTTMPHEVSVSLNGSSIGRVVFNGQAKAQEKIEVTHAMLQEGENVIALESLNGPSDISLVDFIRITYQHGYRAENNALSFTAKSGQTTTVNGFSSSDVRVFDVTDERNVRELGVSIEQAKDGYAATVTASGVGLGTPGMSERKLLALTDQRALSATSVKANTPSHLLDANNAADFIIIVGVGLVDSLRPLAELRRKQGLVSAVVDIEDVYDELSFGNKSPESIRDFISYAVKSWRVRPRFVLFAGDASYDARNYLGFGDNDLVPTKLVDTVYMETASDDWLADFDNDGIAEVSIGRLPVRTAEEAAVVVGKLIAYEKSSPSNEVALVADSNDGFDFEQASTSLREFLPPGLRVSEIFRSRTDDATARTQLLEAINRGEKIVNYTGHGSVNVWRGNLLTGADAELFTNGDRLSLFVTMTCLNGYFQDAMNDSLGESLLKAEKGGAVAVWASSAMCLPEQQALMNRELYRLLFSGTNRGATLAELMGQAKRAVRDADIRRSWILLGDPTMRLK